MFGLKLGPFVGGLSESGAHLWGRAHGPGQLHAWLGRQPDMSDARLAGTSQPLQAETGFAGVAPVDALSPDTRYHYALTLDDSPPKPDVAPFPAFSTFPSPGTRTTIQFAFGSCFRPGGPDASAIFRQIARRRSVHDLRFLLMLGDQIYADDRANNGLGRVATTLEDYRAVYEHGWANPDLRALLADLPVFMTADDHEVDDDWTWTDADRQQAQIPIWDRVIRWWQRCAPEERRIPRERVQAALQACWEHEGMHAPHPLHPPPVDPAGRYRLAAGESGSLAYTFHCGPAAFFVMDTRTQRIKRRGHRTILGESQWRALEKWLLEVATEFPVKFVVTSSALLYDSWIDLARDRWNGFVEERDRLLHFLASNGIEGVYVLTGDLHAAHAVRADLYGPAERALPLWEFCSSPFNQDPNNLTTRTYRRLRTGPIRSQERYFIVSQRNYGLVRVDFPDGGHARVRFRVYGENGELLASVGSGR